MKHSTTKYVMIIGLSIAGVLGMTIITSPYWISHIRPSYQLGYKDQLMSDLRQYLARDDETAVEMVNERQEGNGTVIIYGYDLISASDHQKHGRLVILARNNSVTTVGASWQHDNNTILHKSGNLILSAMADLMIPDWQKDDGQAYRNIEVLKIADAQPLYQYYDNFHLEEDRYLRFLKSEDGYNVDLNIEPAF